MVVHVLLDSLKLIPKGNNNPSKIYLKFMDFIHFHCFSLDFGGFNQILGIGLTIIFFWVFQNLHRFNRFYIYDLVIE